MKSKLLLLIVVAFLASSANAALVEFRFEAVVTIFTLTNASQPDSIELGDSLTGVFTIDTGVEPSFLDETTSVWLNAIVASTILIGDYVINFNATPGFFNTVSVISDTDSVFEGSYPTTSNDIDGFEAIISAFFVRDSNSSLFSDLQIPLNFDDVGQFTGGVVFQTTGPVFGTAGVSYRITSFEATPVPLPGAALLFFPAALALFGLRRR